MNRLRKKEESYVVYILECIDHTYYTGMTNDLRNRLQQHQQGKGAKYTRGRLPVILKYVEKGGDQSWARRREKQIQRMCRGKKEKLMQERGVISYFGYTEKF